MALPPPPPTPIIFIALEVPSVKLYVKLEEFFCGTYYVGLGYLFIFLIMNTLLPKYTKILIFRISLHKISKIPIYITYFQF